MTSTLQTWMAKRHWCGTLNNYNQDEFEWMMIESDLTSDVLSHDIRYLVVGMEEGEEGTPHLQIYVELTKPMRMRQVQRMLSPWRPTQLHLEPRRGTREQAREYIASEEKPTTAGWVEWGIWSENGQGNRSDLLQVKAMVDRGATMDEIAEEYFTTWVYSYRALQTYQILKSRSSIPTWRNMVTKVFWGPTGVGKTRAAFGVSTSVWLMEQPTNGAIWFDGYESQKVWILDDFTGWIPLALLLRLLDGYPMRLPVKGAHVYAAWDTVIITSNIPPHKWYSPDVEAKHPGALARRLKKIYKFEEDRVTEEPWGYEVAPIFIRNSTYPLSYTSTVTLRSVTRVILYDLVTCPSLY